MTSKVIFLTVLLGYIVFPGSQILAQYRSPTSEEWLGGEILSRGDDEQPVDKFRKQALQTVTLS